MGFLMSADLPPVGELVQITTSADGKVIGALRNGLFYAANGDGCWSPQYIASWCPVMVLPDDGTLLTGRIGLALAETEGQSDFSQARAVLAAVRGAAIRLSTTESLLAEEADATEAGADVDVPMVRNRPKKDGT